MSDQLKADKYIQMNKYGEVDQDKIDEAVDDVNLTPNTKKRTFEEKETKEIQKLGPFATYMSLLKGFVCCGILALPKSFENGGWAF